MNDIIKPMNIDLTKNLHGHVRVELRDRWTGRVVDSQEKGNLVTNAVQKMIMTQAWASSAMGTLWTPIYEKVLGTVLLFDNTLTESASNTGFPSSAKLTAFAGQNSNTTDPHAGSYNATESVFTSNGFTTVWDFATSQANGTIASLSRTSWLFGVFPVCTLANTYTLYSGAPSDAFNAFYAPIGYDDTNKYLYLTRISAQTINGVSYSTSAIYKIKLDFSKIALYTAMPPASQVELVKTLSSSDGTTTARYFTYDPYANNFVYASGTTLHIVAMDGTHTTKTITNGASLAITENYYWRSGGTTVSRITKTNTADIHSYSVSAGDCVAPLENDVVVAWTTTSGATSILYPDNSVVELPLSNGAGSSLRPNLGVFHATSNISGNTGSQPNWQWLYPSAHYLGTIANLDSPVTKTSSQTMKITYTLTET